LILASVNVSTVPDFLDRSITLGLFLSPIFSISASVN
jgi:hypothetical protein